MSKDVVAFVIGIHEVKKGTGWVETVRLSKKEQAEIGNRTKVGHNKDKKPIGTKSKEKRYSALRRHSKTYENDH